MSQASPLISQGKHRKQPSSSLIRADGCLSSWKGHRVVRQPPCPVDMPSQPYDSSTGPIGGFSLDACALCIGCDDAGGDHGGVSLGGLLEGGQLGCHLQL